MDSFWHFVDSLAKCVWPFGQGALGPGCSSQFNAKSDGMCNRQDRVLRGSRGGSCEKEVQERVRIDRPRKMPGVEARDTMDVDVKRF